MPTGKRRGSIGQADITESMRAILVDWLVEVQESFEKDLSDRFGNMVKEWRRERAGESLFNPSYLSKE